MAVTKEEVKSFIRAVRIELDARYAAKFASAASLAVIKSDLTELQSKIDDATVDTDSFVQKEDGKTLSSNDFTDEDKRILEELSNNASFDASDLLDVFED